MAYEKIAEYKLQQLEKDYRECLEAEIKTTAADQFRGLANVLAQEDDGFGDF